MYYMLERYKEKVTDLDSITNILTLYDSLHFLFVILFANSVFHDKGVSADNKNTSCFWDC